MKVISRLYAFAFFPFLLPVFVVLHTSRYFLGIVPFGGAVEVALLYLVITLAVYGILRKALGQGAGTSLAALLVTALFVYWQEIVRRMDLLFGTENYTRLPVLILVWIAASLLLGRALNRQPLPTRTKTAFYFNALFLLYIVFELGMMGYDARMIQQDPPLIAFSDTAADQQILSRPQAPSVYLLLLDEYSSSASLKEEWGFDNSAIDTALVQRHFRINTSSQSNYQLTFLSMASMLNMDYLNPVFEAQRLEYKAYARFQKWLYHPRAVKCFTRAGYTFYNRSIFEIAGQLKPELHDVLVNRRDLLTVNNFYHLLTQKYIPYLRNRSAIKHNPEFHDPAFYFMDDYNRKRAAEVTAISHSKSAGPKFVYAHFELPHYPFFYDSAGRYLPVAVVKATAPNSSVPLYLNNVRQANRLLLQMVDAIMKNESGQAVILVLGDHGYRTGEKVKHTAEPFRNYSAIYYPDHNYSAVPDSLTNVNLFRVVFNKIFGTNYPLLKNKSREIREAEKTVF